MDTESSATSHDSVESSTARGRLTRALRTPVGAFALALASLMTIAAGLALDGWMLTLPSNVDTSCMTPVCDVNPHTQLWIGLLIAVVGVVIFIVAWKFDGRHSARRRQGWKALRTWGAPLFWLAFVPIPGVLISSLIAGIELHEPPCTIAFFVGACPVSALVPAVLIPGALNLFTLHWLRSVDPRARIAAIVASMLGVAGLVGSLVALAVQGPLVEVPYGTYLPPLPPPGRAGLAFGTVVWLSTLIALLVIAKLPVVPVRDSSGPGHA